MSKTVTYKMDLNNPPVLSEEQKTRLERLNEIAKKQYNILQDSKGIKKLEGLDNNYYIK